MPPPPPEEKQAEAKPVIKTVEIDLRHSVKFTADKTISMPNVMLVIQNSAAKDASFGITLTTSRASADGSRMVFGALESGKDLDEVLKGTMNFASGSILDPTGNGVFTTTTIYQPKFVSMKLTSVNGDEASGMISGEFYKFSALTPTAKPTVVKAEGTFQATLVRK